VLTALAGQVEASAGGPDNLVAITMVKQRGGAETTAA
jgi:hypothetical protein